MWQLVKDITVYDFAFLKSGLQRIANGHPLVFHLQIIDGVLRQAFAIFVIIYKVEFVEESFRTDLIAVKRPIVF